MKRLPAISLVLAFGAQIAAGALTAEEIIDRMEQNTVFQTSRAEGAMIIRDRFGTKETRFISYSRGKDTTLIEFTSLEERGMKILRTEEEIYLFYPDAEELIRLQGAALRDSVLGSDMSYEDMTGGKGLLDSYTVTLAGTESVNGHGCYRIDMEARRRNVAYAKQTVWVDTGLFIYRRVHKFSRSGKLLKEMEVEKIQEIQGHQIATRMILRDTLKSSSSTEFVIDDIAINPPLDPDIFSLRTLTW